jgi:hypothetical protein
MAENETEALEAEDAGLSEDSELDVGAIVEGLVAGQAEDTDETADTVTTVDEEVFVPTDTQVELAKQLGYSAEEIAGMDEAEARAVDKLARLDSRRQQRKGKEARKETVVDAESSIDDDVIDDDGEFTEDDWFTDAGRKKINAALKASNQTKNTDKQRSQAEINKVFDSLDKEAFEAFLPGESDLIEPGSPAELRRAEALTMAKSIQAVRDAQGREIPLEKAILKALSIVAETETENAALNKANAGRKKRGSQRISTPSTTTGKHKVRHETPEEQAVADVMEELSPT